MASNLVRRAAIATAGVATLAGVALVTTADERADVFVKPSDSIQAVLDKVKPGTTVHLAPGVYAQSFQSTVDATEGAPVRVTGPREAVVTGRPGNALCGTACVALIRHDHWELDGFTIDGGRVDREGRQVGMAQLVLILGRDGWQNDRPPEGVDGAAVRNMAIRGARFSCVMVRWWADGVRVVDNTVSRCGLDPASQVGEGVYVGTDGQRLVEVGARSFDHSRRTLVARNRIDVAGGSECIELKPMANENVVADNDCSGTADGGAGIRVKGSRNVLTGNRVHDLRDVNGAAFAFDGGPYADFDNGQRGTVTVGVANSLRDNTAGPGVRFGVTGRVAGLQAAVCGNRMPVSVDVTFDPTAPCPVPPPPVTTTTTTTVPTTTTTTTTEPVFYPNCAAARAAGAAPLIETDPGYRLRLDGDKDGIACE